MDLGSLLFGSYRKRVLALLLLHPEQALHVRELARQLDKPPGTLLREGCSGGRAEQRYPA